MAKKLYLGVDNVAKKVSDIVVGVGDVARKVKKVYIGDSNNIARLTYDNTPTKLIIKPYALYGKDYPDGAWNSDISSYGYINYISSKQLQQINFSMKQIVSYHRILFGFADGREEDIAHYCHDANRSVIINATNTISSNYSGTGGWNASIDDVACRPDDFGTVTKNITIPSNHTTQSLVVMGSVYGSFLYLSCWSSSGTIQVTNTFTFNSCTINGTSLPIELRTS